MTKFWLDRQVFVTGATGLVGSALVEKLISAGANVVCLVRDNVPNSEFYRKGLNGGVVSVRGDLSQLDLLKRILNEYEIDTVIHLAAQAIVGVANCAPVNTFQSNVAGTWNLLDACLVNSRVNSVVVASSDKAYGDQKELPYTEDAPLLGAHAYDLSKAMADRLAQFYAVQGLPVAITRCGNFYGAGDLNWNRLIPGTIRSILRGHPPVIRSDGGNIRDYFYVEDGAEAYMLLAEKLRQNQDLSGEAFNFSLEGKYSVLDIVNVILQLMGSDLQPIIGNFASDEILHQYLSSEKAKSVLGWKPKFGLPRGLELTIEWYEEFLL